jgi:hypothetical protein
MRPEYQNASFGSGNGVISGKKYQKLSCTIRPIVLLLVLDEKPIIE